MDGGSSIQKIVADYLKEIWGIAGINVTLKPLPKGEKLKRMFEKTCEACIGEKGLDYPDGFSVLTYFKSGYPSNYFQVEDKGVDLAIENAARTTNQAQREIQYRETQVKILEHFTVIPLFFGSQASGLWSPRVKYVPSHPMGFHVLPLETVELRSDHAK